MHIYSIFITFFFIFIGSILPASDFNYDTGLALKSDLADKATITSTHMYNDRILAVGVHGIILISNDMGLTWTQPEEVPFINTLTDVKCINEWIKSTENKCIEYKCDCCSKITEKKSIGNHQSDINNNILVFCCVKCFLGSNNK